MLEAIVFRGLDFAEDAEQNQRHETLSLSTGVGSFKMKTLPSDRLAVLCALWFGTLAGLQSYWLAKAFPEDFGRDPFMGIAFIVSAGMAGGLLASHQLEKAVPRRHGWLRTLYIIPLQLVAETVCITAILIAVSALTRGMAFAFSSLLIVPIFFLIVHGMWSLIRLGIGVPIAFAALVIQSRLSQQHAGGLR